MLHADVYQVEVEIGSLVDGACLIDRASVFDSVVCPNGSDRASLMELNVSCSMRGIPCLPVSAAVTPAWLHVGYQLSAPLPSSSFRPSLSTASLRPGVPGWVDSADELPARNTPCLPDPLPGVLLSTFWPQLLKHKAS